MPNYQNAKIYKIWDNGYNKCYIGSTCEELSRRMAGHRRNYISYKQGEFPYLTAFSLFDEYEVENCKIELLELYPCNSKVELNAREGFHQRNTDCVNKNISGRTPAEYTQDNRSKIHSYNKNYYENKKDILKEKANDYRQQNIEKCRENDRQRYKCKREDILQKLAEVIDCECGRTYTKSHKSRHFKTKQHQQFLESIRQEEQQEER